MREVKSGVVNPVEIINNKAGNVRKIEELQK